MKKIGGLQKRWLVNTVGVIFALGLMCVIAITAVFGTYYYSSIIADMRYRAKTTTDFFSEYISISYKEYYQSCINYANSFDGKNKPELQFIDHNYRLVASSYGVWPCQTPNTSDIYDAFSLREISSFSGEDPNTGERILAVSSPMIYSNGEVIGVLRFVTSTRLMDLQILKIFLSSMTILGLMLLVVFLTGNYFIRSILVPVGEITEKAKRISSGSYGIQIQTHYNDEVGELAETINAMSILISIKKKK